jgi:tetratricopeptide (TPR) repeat protein
VERKSIAVTSDAKRTTPQGPAQLPLDIHGFTGRCAALSGLDLLIHDDPEDRPHAVLITAIQGMPGIGKTALAVHWAHHVAHRFPDGQLYIDLGGHSSRGAVTISDALGHLLRGLGVDGTQIPADETERAAVYRSASADRQVLIVLDNAASAEQVRPLLPGSPLCLVVVTSRSQLVGLVAHDGARTIDLDVLSPDESAELLAAILGPERVATETGPTAELARLCAHLPLALRVAAADLASRPHDSIAGAVRELAADRLSALVIDEDPRSAVQAAFELSFQRLSDDAKLAFRRLGLIEVPDFTPGAVAALLGWQTESAQRALRGLVRANLVEANRPGRYRLHDLLRDYARILTRSEDTDAYRSDAVRKLLGWYLIRSREAAQVLHPHRRPLSALPEPAQPGVVLGYADALSWFEGERSNLIGAILQAERFELDEFTWEIADALYDFLDLRGYHVDNIGIHRTGLAAATRHANALARAYMLQHLAVIETHRGHYAEAIGNAQGALAELRQLRDPYAESAPLNALARIYLRLGRYPEAREQGQEALRIRRHIGDRRGEAETLDNLVSLSWRLGNYPDAVRDGNQALGIWREIGDRRGEGEALTNIATVQLSVGESEHALRAASAALEIARQIGDQYGIANALATLSNICRKLARYPDAIARAEEALVIRREIADLRGEAAVLVNEGKIYTEAGRYSEALRCLRDALKIQGDIGDRQGVGETRRETAYAYWRRGRYPQALEHLRQALTIQREIGDRSGEGETLDIMGRVRRRMGDYPAAMRLGRASLRIRREIGDRSGEGECLGGIARVQRRLDRFAAALQNARAALAIFESVGSRRCETAALDNIARITRRMGDPLAALPLAEQAVRISCEVGHRYDESLARDGLARIRLQLDDPTGALDEAMAALAIERDIGNLYGAGQTLLALCLIHERLGRLRDALDHGNQSAQVLSEIGDAAGEATALAAMARISQSLNRPPAPGHR